MRVPQLLDLTKREQRVVIIVILALLAGSIAIHYRDLSTPLPAEIPAAASPAAPALNTKEDAAPNESPDIDRVAPAP